MNEFHMRHFLLMQARYLTVCLVLAAIYSFLLDWRSGLSLLIVIYFIPLPIALYIYRNVLRSVFTQWWKKRKRG